MQFHLVNLMCIGVIPYTDTLFVYEVMRLVTEDDFSAKIGMFFQTLQNPVNDHMALSMIIKFEFLGELNSVRVRPQIPS